MQINEAEQSKDDGVKSEGDRQSVISKKSEKSEKSAVSDDKKSKVSVTTLSNTLSLHSINYQIFCITDLEIKNKQITLIFYATVLFSLFTLSLSIFLSNY
jgi:hypothetical protein